MTSGTHQPIDPNNRKPLEVFLAITDMSLLIFFSLVFVLSMIMLHKRKDFQPLKSRSYALLQISNVGNFMYFVMILLDKIIVNNIWPVWDDLQPRPETIPPDYDVVRDNNRHLFSTIEVSCYLEYLQGMLARPILWAPYFFRAIRLYQIWNLSDSIQKNTGKKDQVWTYFIRQRNSQMWLFIVLSPFLIMVIISAFTPFVAEVFPVFGMQQCSEFTGIKNGITPEEYNDDMKAAMSGAMFENCFLSMGFIFTIFMLRKIDDKFSMNWELQRVTLVKIVLDGCWIFSLLFLTETWFVVFGFLMYFNVLLCICILFISVIEPIKGTYQANQIIPFPLNIEMLKDAESSMAHQISSRYFYDFLCRDLKDLKSLSIFSLYSDLKRYQIYCDNDSIKYDDIKELANEIFNDYIVPGAEFEIPTNQIITDLRAKYDFQRREINCYTRCNEQLFEALFGFSVGGLNTYYEIFEHSPKFVELKAEVERQEELYNVLARYHFISN